MKKETEYDYETSLGKEVAHLLNLKFNKEGRVNTSFGTKTVKGLGASIRRLIEEEDNRANRNADLAENDENFHKFGIISKEEYEAQKNKVNSAYNNDKGNLFVNP